MQAVCLGLNTQLGIPNPEPKYPTAGSLDPSNFIKRHEHTYHKQKPIRFLCQFRDTWTLKALGFVVCRSFEPSSGGR